MYRPDYRLVIAVIAPLLIWPWVPAWDSSSKPEGIIGVTLLVILMPIAEEIVFRGFVQGGLLYIPRFTQKFMGFSIANWATSVIFAAAHGWQHALPLVPGYLAVSLVLGYFRERYGGISVPILLHGYYNFGLLLTAA